MSDVVNCQQGISCAKVLVTALTCQQADTQRAAIDHLNQCPICQSYTADVDKLAQAFIATMDVDHPNLIDCQEGLLSAFVCRLVIIDPVAKKHVADCLYCQHWQTQHHLALPA